MSDFGHIEGETCNRNGCKGFIEEHATEDCSCHISPPCSSCTSDRSYCDTCDWVGAEDRIMNDFVVSVDRKTGVYTSWEPRPLDAAKIDWHSKFHSNSSMIKEGVFPPGATAAEVEKEVRGTFGGRFEYFRDGAFKYIAYTD